MLVSLGSFVREDEEQSTVGELVRRTGKFEKRWFALLMLLMIHSFSLTIKIWASHDSRFERNVRHPYKLAYLDLALLVTLSSVSSCRSSLAFPRVALSIDLILGWSYELIPESSSCTRACFWFCSHVVKRIECFFVRFFQRASSPLLLLVQSGLSAPLLSRQDWTMASNLLPFVILDVILASFLNDLDGVVFCVRAIDRDKTRKKHQATIKSRQKISRIDWDGIHCIRTGMIPAVQL